MIKIAWRWRWPDLDSNLFVSQSVFDLLCKHRQSDSGVEQGGQLFVDPHSPVGLLLAVATAPHRSDRAGRTWLEMDAKRCTEEISQANSVGLRLVGYWHSHPQTIPSISSTDIRSFSRFSARYTEELPHPLAIIVGRSQEPEGIKAWLFREGVYVEGIFDK
jgi:hypothetical protein